MALNIKNPEVVQLTTEVAQTGGRNQDGSHPPGANRAQGPSPIEGGRLNRKESLLQFLEREVWPHVPPGELGRTLTREEEDDILGFGPDGV